MDGWVEEPCANQRDGIDLETRCLPQLLVSCVVHLCRRREVTRESNIGDYEFENVESNLKVPLWYHADSRSPVPGCQLPGRFLLSGSWPDREFGRPGKDDREETTG